MGRKFDEIVRANEQPVKRQPSSDSGDCSAADMRAIVEQLGFDPTNHHNASVCPYCTPHPDKLSLRVMDMHMEEMVRSLAPAVCTPEEGYKKDGGLSLAASDTARLRDKFMKLISDVGGILDLAGSRYMEWGERAESCFEQLEKSLDEARKG